MRKTILALELPQMLTGSVRLPERLWGTSLCQECGLNPRGYKASNSRCLTVPDTGYSTVPGEPELPAVRSLLVVPDAADVSATITGETFTVSLADVGIDFPLIPLQAPLPKQPGEPELAALNVNATVYASDQFVPETAIRVAEAGHVNGQRLIAVEINPISYNPVGQTLKVYESLTFNIELGSSTQLAGLQPAAASEADPPQDTGLGEELQSARAEEAAVSTNRLLVIAHDDFASDLGTFAEHKTNMGWDVDLVSTSTAGTSAPQIRSYIQSQYNDYAMRPDAVLLVGDTDRIPHFVGSGPSSPDTDLYYATMDGGDDWYPEFPVGRFSVRSSVELADVITKTVEYETEPVGTWTTHVAFMAGADNYQISEGTHNWVIDRYLDPLGYTSDRVFTVAHGATRQEVSDSFNDQCMMGIFSGHASTSSWVDGPPFSRTDVENLTNTGAYPFIASFACDTGNYVVDESLAETWLRVADKGAVASWAASDTSYWAEDDILEKALFRAIYDDDQVAFGDATLRAKELYLEYFGPTPTTRCYFEMYNLFGDPTVALQVQADSVTLQLPATVWEGQGTLVDAGSLTMVSPLAHDLVVTLESDDVSELTVPATVTIPAGLTSATFDLTVQDDADCDGSQPAIVTVTVAGMVAGSSTARVGDNEVHHFDFSAISSPQVVGAPISVTITAKDADNETIQIFDACRIDGHR